MCLIVFAWRPEHDTPLVLLANRDEFFERPAEPMQWWADRPDVLAGRDLRGGGTWMGITRAGRFAALTNFRDGRAPMAPKDTPSRGLLVSAMLDATPFDADLRRVENHAHEYAGFNLVAGDLPAGDLFWLGNRENGAQAVHRFHRVTPGVHGLSNALLDTPWPKLVSRRDALAAALHDNAGDDTLLDLMRDATPAADDRLPDTGVPHAWERTLSSAFIASPAYGTRCTTLLRFSRDGSVTAIEATVSPGQNPHTPGIRRRYSFAVERMASPVK
ncbi:NRDE family protein [Pandoraea terrae]|uniref:NRDE family protein n=1 Tax=Pandoraea terrae TaxID=1537710 RepID=A0A5E4SEH4_9BURK|nr:NRDE family protein [Pandoraea terrae]VVD73503.1 NRDE family protein [Pandoraea terrae]